MPNSTVFADVLAHTTLTQITPTFYGFSSLGSFPLTLTYPDPGTLLLLGTGLLGLAFLAKKPWSVISGSQ